MTSSITAALARKRSEIGDKEKGFTLIELLVVVIIIGILAAVAIPIFLGQQDMAKDKATIAQVTNAKTAVVAHLVSGAAPDFALSTATGFTQSEDIPVVLTWTADKTGFCISGADIDGGHKAAIDDKGAAKAGATCTLAGARSA